MPQISVIVPVYKVEKYLDRCIKSVLAQTYTDFELILIDDGSPDQCGKICDKYAELDSRIIVVHQLNSGLSSARNTGLDIAKGSYIAFVDSDDYIRLDMLETLYQSARSNDADISVCRYESVDEDTGCISKETGIFDREIIDNITALQLLTYDMQGTMGFVWNKLYKIDLFSTIRFPIGKIYEDALVMHEILYRCRHIAFVNESLYYYYQRQGSIINSEFTIRRFDHVEAFYKQAEFYYSHGLYELVEPSVASAFNSFVYIRNKIQKIDKSDLRRYFEVKNKVRNSLIKYKKKITMIEAIEFEIPGLIRYFSRIKRKAIMYSKK